MKELKDLRVNALESSKGSELMQTVILRDRFEKRIDYTKLHGIQWHLKELIKAVKDLDDAAKADGFTDDDVCRMLEYYEELVITEIKQDL